MNSLFYQFFAKATLQFGILEILLKKCAICLDFQITNCLQLEYIRGELANPQKGDTMDNNSKLESLKQKRADAGRKGGKAPHKCRGRQCKKAQSTNQENTSTNAQSLSNRSSTSSYTPDNTVTRNY